MNVGKGDGTFQSAITIGQDYFGGAGIGFGDFNDNGTLDLVYGWQDSKSGLCDYQGNPPCYLKVLLNKGSGKFHGLPPFGRYSNQVAAAVIAGDFNNDGILDLAAFEGYDVLVFLGNGDGTFKRKQTIHFQNPGGFAAVTADFNGDGKLDLVAAYGSNNLYLMLGNGDGTFQKPRRILTDKYEIGCGTGQGSLAVNDFNGDGNPDLAFCDRRSSGGSVAVRLGILLGNGDGTFQRVAYYSPGAPYGGFFAAGDFNSDGKTDLIFSGLDSEYSPQFDVLWGNGDGTFQRPKRIYLPHFYGGLPVLGDFNSDGLLDFVEVVPEGLWVYVQK